MKMMIKLQSNLVTMDDEATVTFNVINESNGIATLLSLEITNSNTEYFNVSKDIQKTNLLAGENTNVTITVSLKKLPISESVSSSIKLKIKANPIENEETLYLYGNPNTPGIQTYTNYYDLNKNVFLSKRGNNIELCIIKKGTVTCMTNDYNTSDSVMIRAIRGENDEGYCSFGAMDHPDCDPWEDEDCELINMSSCSYNGLSCNISSDNYISCYDNTTNARCYINTEGAGCN